MNTRQRMSSAERKEQVVHVALDLISRLGVQGTTLTRIAAGAGVTTAGLYSHFKNKKEIMVAALDVLFDRIRDVDRSSSQHSALERLREIGLHHTKLLRSSQDGFVFPLFEFIAAPPDENLRDELRTRQLERVEEVADIVREGQQQGSISTEVDPVQIAWMIISRAWTEDIAMLMGLNDRFNEARSVQLLDVILGLAAPRTDHVSQDAPKH